MAHFTDSRSPVHYPYRQKNDCSVIAVAALAEIPYEAAARVLRANGREDDDGATDTQWKASLTALGFTVRRVVSLRRTIRTVSRALPVTGRYLITTSDHMVAYIHGELIDDTKYSDLMRVENVYKIDDFC